MTITEYMTDIALESTLVANDMECDAMLCAYYESTSDDSDTAFATESSALALTFDDEDEVVADAEPATEKAGFFQKLGGKFKNVLDAVKGWFEKIAKTIKEWISKFVESVKDKIAAFKNRQAAKDKAGIEADIQSTQAEMKKKYAEFDTKEAELRKKLDDPKQTNKDKIQDELRKLGAAKRAYEEKMNAKADGMAEKYGKIVANEMKTAMKTANHAFDVAVNSEKTILKMLSDIMKTKQSKSDTAGTIGSKLGYDAMNQSLKYNSLTRENEKNDVAMLNKVKKDDAEKYLKTLEKITESVDKEKVSLETAVEAHAKAYEQFTSQVPTFTMQVKILSKVGGAVPSKAVIDTAERMEKECTALASSTQSLSEAVVNVTGNENASMAKVMSAYSSVASKIASIATEYLKIGTKVQAGTVAEVIAAGISGTL